MARVASAYTCIYTKNQLHTSEWVFIDRQTKRFL